MSDICDSQRSISYVRGSVVPVAQSVQARRRYAKAMDRLHVHPQIYMAFGIAIQMKMGDEISRDIHVLK